MKRFILPALLLAIFFSGCAVFVNDETPSRNDLVPQMEKKIFVRGSISHKGAVPSLIFQNQNEEEDGVLLRTAMPSIPSGAEYWVTATCTGKTPLKSKASYNSTTKNYDFLIGLTTGKWSISAMLVTGAGTASEKILLKDSLTKNLTVNDTSVNLSFMLKPLSTGKGNISLSVRKDPGLSASTVKVICPAFAKLGLPSAATYTPDFTYTVNEVPGGIYDITLNFYNGSILLYSTTQTVNVVPKMTTDKWVRGSEYDAFITSGGDFVLTNEIVDSFIRSTFYVADNGDSENSGSPYAPLDTVSNCIGRISSLNSGVQYRIFVKTGHSEDIASKITVDRNVCIEPYTSYPGDNTGTMTLTRRFNGTDSAIFVAGTYSLEIHNAIIQGTGELIQTDKSSAIISNGTLRLYDSTIQRFYSENGSGLYVGGGETYLINTKILKNKAVSNGGGISVCGGSVSFESGEISGNEIGVSGPNSDSIGGGVCVDGGQFTMKGGVIKNNVCRSAGKGGAGVGVRTGTFNFYGGTIKDNVGGIGKGLYYCGGTVSMKGSAFVGSGNDIGFADGNTEKIEIAGELTSEEFMSVNIFGTITNGKQIFRGERKFLEKACEVFEIPGSNWGIFVEDTGRTCAVKPVCYVAGPAGKHSAFVGNGASGNPGTRLRPCASVHEANEKVTVEDRVILVDGETTDSSHFVVNQKTLICKNSRALEAVVEYTASVNEYYINQKKDLKIKGLTLKYTGDKKGGAIEVTAASTLTLEDARIQNFCKADKPGVYLNKSGSSVKLVGNTAITGCRATNPTGTGSGIYSTAGTNIHILDSAYLDSTSDIYLAQNVKVTVGNDLTLPVEARRVAAVITPYSYTVGNQLLAETSGSLIARNFRKFRVRPETNKDWMISNQGKLIEELLVADIADLKGGLSEGGLYTMSGNTFTADSTQISDNTLFNIDGVDVNVNGGSSANHGKINLSSVQGRAFTVSGDCNVKISNIDFTSNHDGSSYDNGYYGQYHGTGILVKSGAKVTVENCIFEKLSIDIHRWWAGGGFAGIIEVEDGGEVIIKNCTLKDSKFLSNAAWCGAVCVQSGGKAEIEDTTITNITGTHAGAGVMILGNCTMKDCAINGNYSADGAGIYLYDNNATLQATSCTITGNKANRSASESEKRGGAGIINGTNASATFVQCNISGNTAGSGSGGAFYINCGSLSLDTVSAGNLSSSHDVYVNANAKYNGTVYASGTKITTP